MNLTSTHICVAVIANIRILQEHIHYIANDCSLLVLYILRFENFVSHSNYLKPIDPTYNLAITLPTTLPGTVSFTCFPQLCLMLYEKHLNFSVQ
jgi:hypothetical protein